MAARPSPCLNRPKNERPRGTLLRGTFQTLPAATPVIFKGSQMIAGMKDQMTYAL